MAKKKTAAKKAAAKKPAAKKPAAKKTAAKKTAAKKTAAKKTAAKKTAAKKSQKAAAAPAPAAPQKAAPKKGAQGRAVRAKQAAPASGTSPAKKNSQGVLEDVTLNWTDLTGAKTGATSLGSNKFYKATITESSPGIFTVTYRYGRVGTDGQVQVENFGTLDQARRKLESKIRSKERKGYTRLEMRSEEDERAKAQAKGIQVGGPKRSKRKTPSRNFHPQVASLLKTMYSATGKAVRAGLSSSSGATEDAPLGNLHDSQLDRGADILDKIDGLLGRKRKPAREQLIKLTNEYLSNIPRNIDHARSAGRLDLDRVLLNSSERIGKEREFITLLRDAHLAKEIFAAAAHADDPVEVWYEGLNCALEYVDPSSKEHSRVQDLFDRGQSPKNSNFFGKLKVARVWRLERNGEKSAFDGYAKTIARRKGATGLVPAWHGTRTENLMGIARSGLLMPENLPKGVQVTGKAFGMGIYHAPCWPDAGTPRQQNGETYTRYNGALKSMNYTSIAGAYWNSASSGTKGFLFLEELALGLPEVHLTACWDKHRPDNGADYIYAKAFGNDQLSHDEVVTFDENASRMTHMLEIEHR